MERTLNLQSIPDALWGAIATAFVGTVGWFGKRLFDQRPRHVTTAEARKADAEAGNANAESASHIATAYEKLVRDLQSDIERQDQHITALREEGRRLRNRVDGLGKLLKAAFAYADTLEGLVVQLGGQLPERPRIIEVGAAEVPA